MIQFLATELAIATETTEDSWIKEADNASGDNEYTSEEIDMLQSLDELKEMEAELSYYKTVNRILQAQLEEYDQR